MYAGSKLHQVRKEAIRIYIDVLGLPEVRWTGNGKLQTDDWTLNYKGDDNEHQRGVGIMLVSCWYHVGIMLASKTAKAVMKIVQISDRAILNRIAAKPKSIMNHMMYVDELCISLPNVSVFVVASMA